MQHMLFVTQESEFAERCARMRALAGRLGSRRSFGFDGLAAAPAKHDGNATISNRPALAK
jgi:hypothetical protein